MYICFNLFNSFVVKHDVKLFEQKFEWTLIQTILLTFTGYESLSMAIGQLVFTEWFLVRYEPFFRTFSLL